jgi:TPP-dependent indolepyruvate ferredoxin oxidoreductase alpha subunit
MAMTAKRRNKLRKLAEELPVPEIFGDQEGDTLLIGWGSTYGPIHDAVKMGREQGEKIAAIHFRHLHPLPNGIEKIFAKFKRVVVVEMNDQGVYGFGQFATILRARYCEPKIESFTKTDGLTFRVKEILEGVFKRSFTPSKNGATSPVAAAVSAANGSAESATPEVSTRADMAGDNTPTMPGAEASRASSGIVEHSKHPPGERAEGASIAMTGSDSENNRNE